MVQGLVLLAACVGLVAVAIALRDAVSAKACEQTQAIGAIGEAGGGGGCGEASVARFMPAAEEPGPQMPPPSGGAPQGSPVAASDRCAGQGTVSVKDWGGRVVTSVTLSGGPFPGGAIWMPGSDYASPLPGTYPEGSPAVRWNVKTGAVDEYYDGLLGQSAPRWDFTAGWLSPGWNEGDADPSRVVDTSCFPAQTDTGPVADSSWERNNSLWADDPGDVPIYHNPTVAGVMTGGGATPIVCLANGGLSLFGAEWTWGGRFCEQTTAIAENTAEGRDAATVTTLVGLAVDVFTFGGTGIRHIGDAADVVDGALISVRSSDNVYPLFHGETGRIIGEVPGDTPIFRIEPRNTPTPMEPHPSPYYEPGRIHAGPDGDALFLADSRQALADLERLRREQGYFETEDLVLRATTYDELLAAFPDARIMTDAKMEFGRGIEGARLVVVPRGTVPREPLHFQEFDPAEIPRVTDSLPDTHAIRLDPDIKDGIDSLEVGESAVIPRGEFDTTGVAEYAGEKGFSTFVDADGNLNVVNGPTPAP